MASDKISQKISDLYEHIEGLKIKGIADPERVAEVLSDALEELESSLEELSAAEEELCQQNDELIKVTEDLAESESLLRSFFDSPGLMRGIVEIIADDDVRHIADNEVTAGFLGMTPEAMKGKLGSELGEPRGILQTWVGHYRQSQSTGAPVNFEYQDKRGGHEAWLSATVSYLGTPPEGNPRFAYAVNDITKRKVAEEAQRESERRFRLALRNAPVSVAAQDSDLRYIWAYNQRTARPEEIIGKLDEEIFTPEEAEHLTAIKRRVLQENIEHKETMWLDRPGGRMFLDAYFEPLRDEAGRAIGVGTSTVDLTPMKTAEEALRESEERFRAVMENMSEGLALFDAKGDLIYQNLAALRIHGFELLDGRIEHENLPVTWNIWDEGRLLTFDEWPIKHVLRGERVHNRVFHVRRAETGHEFDASYNGSPIYDLSGNLVGGFLTIRDITDEMRANQALRESEQRLRLATEATNIGAFDWNIQTGLNIWTPELEAMYGLAPGEFGKTQPAWEQLVHSDDRTAAVAAVNRALETGQPVEGEWRIVWRDGSVHWIVGRFQAFKDADGDPLRLIGVNIDITERKRAEIALQEAKEELEVTAEELRLQNDELLNAQSALQESEICFHSVLDNSRDVIYRLNVLTGRYEYISPSCKAIVGYSPEELMGQDAETAMAMIHPEDRQAMLAAVERLKKTGVAEVEYRQMAKDGSYHWLSNHLSQTLDHAGQPLYRDGNIRDVTERKKAEEALKKTSHLLESVFSGMNEGVVILDATGNIIEFNEAFAHICRFKNKEETLRNISKFAALFRTYYLDGSQMPVNEWAASRALAGETGNIENMAERLDTGERFILSSSYAPLRNEQGQITGAVQVSTDITERKRAEEALHRHSAVLAAINRVQELGLGQQTEEEMCQACLGVIEEATGSGISFIGEIGSDGFLHDLAISNPGWEACKMHDRAGHRKPPGNFPLHGIYGRVLSDGKGLIANDPASHPDHVGLPQGHPPLTSFLGVPLQREGKTVGMIAVGNREGGYRVEDRQALEAIAPAIVEALDRKRAEEALKKAHDELELRVQERTAELSQAKEGLEVINEELSVELEEHQRLESELLKAKDLALEAVQAKAAFLANMSHELRTPMNSIIGFTGLLLDEPLSPEQRDYLERARNSGNILLALINDILEFSRVERQKVKLEQHPFSLRALIEESLGLVSVQAKDKGLDLAYTLSYGTPDAIIGDPGRLRQILANLLSNAVKFRTRDRYRYPYPPNPLDRTGFAFSSRSRILALAYPRIPWANYSGPFPR